MVESQTAVVFEPVALDDSDVDSSKKSSGTDLEIHIVKQEPATSSFYSILKHLQSRAGYLSRFRGLSLFIVYQLVLARLSIVFGLIAFIPRGVDVVLATVVLSRISLAWNHIVISEPSTKYWFRRLPSIKLWPKVALPTLVASAAEQISVGLPVGLFLAFGMDKVTQSRVGDMSNSECRAYIIKLLALIALGIFSAIAIVVPATVTLVRVQASLLPEDQETIVPFDRSFGGRVVPAIVGGSGCVGMLDAWKTFDWNSRVRILKVYGKVFLIQFGVYVLFFTLITAELRLILGKDLAEYLKGLHNLYAGMQ
jgi:hypothetical protein